MPVYSELFRSAAGAGRPTGVVVLVHGLGEHSGRYRHVVGAFTGHGYHVLTGDLPGFGQSEGRRGHVDSFGDYLGVADAWVRRGGSEAQGAPVYLMGHSLGGLIALRYAQESGDEGTLAGLILSSPGLKVKAAVPPWKMRIARVLDGLVPRMAMSNEVNAEDLSHDPEVVRAYLSDPLNYGKVTVRWYREFSAAMVEAAARELPSLPTLLLLAGEDRLVDVEFAAARFAGRRNVQVRTFPGMYHETLNEPAKAEVLGAILAWLAGEQR